MPDNENKKQIKSRQRVADHGDYNIKSLMPFRQLLDRCKVEDDVRAAYAKFFDIPFDASEYIDLYTPQVLFEFKYDKNLARHSEKARVLAQSLYYVRRLRFGDIDELKSSEDTLFSTEEMTSLLQGLRPVPPTLCLADVNEAILTPTADWQEFVADEQGRFDWTLSPSSPDERLIKALVNDRKLQELHTFNLKDDQELAFFSERLTEKLQQQLSIEGLQVKKQITEQNFEQVYQYWNRVFGDAVRNGYKPSRYFVSDIQKGNTILNNGSVLFRVDGTYIPKKIVTKDYNWFWSLFDKISDIDTVRGILAKVDRLTDDTLRRFHGEYYTPIPFATKALDYITETIGKEWWKSGEYRLWDMAAGTGNLEYNLPAAAWKYCYLSTLEETDVEHLHRLFPDATVFQYNYLDDDSEHISEKVQKVHQGLGDEETFTPYQKLPVQLVADLANPNLKWIVFINPPFATAQTAGTQIGTSKMGVSDTQIRKMMHSENLGEVSRELFSQFIYRIKYEFHGRQAHLALFSKIKYLNATNDQKLRENLFRFQFEKGFVFSSINFAGTSIASQFPVGMLIWNLNKDENLSEQHISLDIYDTHGIKTGEKTIRIEEKEKFLSKWIARPAATNKFPPLGSAIEVKANNKDRRDRITDGFLASLMCAGNDFQHKNLVYFLSGPSVSAGAFSVTSDNFEQAMVVHTARRAPQATWLNDRDQFMAPQKELSAEFITDCVVWSLFSDSNQTAALKDVVYEGKTYQVHNHFFPFALEEVKQWQVTDPDIRQTLMAGETTFVAQWLAKRVLSTHSAELLACAKEIYKFYFLHLNELRTTKFKIQTWDAGWYQIRMALQNANLAEDLLEQRKQLHRNLRDKLLPQLYEYGIVSSV